MLSSSKRIPQLGDAKALSWPLARTRPLVNQVKKEDESSMILGRVAMFKRCRSLEQPPSSPNLEELCRLLHATCGVRFRPHP